MWRDWQQSGRQRETRGGQDEPASQWMQDTAGKRRQGRRLSNQRDWETGGRQKGDKTPARVSQHLASRHLTGRQEEKREARPLSQRHIFPFFKPQVRTPILRRLGKDGSEGAKAQRPSPRSHHRLDAFGLRIGLWQRSDPQVPHGAFGALLHSGAPLRGAALDQGGKLCFLIEGQRLGPK